MAATSRFWRATTTMDTLSAIDWSPDGTLLAWARNVQHGAQGNSGAVGEPAIAFYDFSGRNRYSSGITSTQLGGRGADSCQNVACMHFSPDTTSLAYQNEYPNGIGCAGSCTISIISLDGANRTGYYGFRSGASFLRDGGAGDPSAREYDTRANHIRVLARIPPNRLFRRCSTAMVT